MSALSSKCLLAVLVGIALLLLPASGIIDTAEAQEGGGAMAGLGLLGGGILWVCGVLGIMISFTVSCVAAIAGFLSNLVVMCPCNSCCGCLFSIPGGGLTGGLCGWFRSVVCDTGLLSYVFQSIKICAIACLQPCWNWAALALFCIQSIPFCNWLVSYPRALVQLCLLWINFCVKMCERVIPVV